MRRDETRFIPLHGTGIKAAGADDFTGVMFR